MLRRNLLLGTAAALVAPSLSRAFAAEPKTIYYNAVEKLDDNSFGGKVLKLALSKCKTPYELRPSPVGYPTQSGAINALATGGALDVCWVGVDKAITKVALPVMFPIDGGMLGYRLFLIGAKRQPEFSAVKTLDDLKRFIAIQGPGWGDIDILRNAGLTVRTGLYKNLFRMTVEGRADYFPRAAFEALNEQAQRVDTVPGLAVETSLILKYPFCLMFYVAKSRPQLQHDLLEGLMTAHADGSYKALFEADANMSTALNKGHFNERTTIEIDNPNMPDDVAAIDRRYWFQA